MITCPRCASPAEVGVLCATCAEVLAPCDGLLRDHLRSGRVAPIDAWLVDGFGAGHPVSAARTRIGRNPGSELMVLHGSVSRDHAAVSRTGDGSWQIRDLGSRNATRLDGRRIAGRATLDDRVVIRVGEVPLLFVARSGALPDHGLTGPGTTRSATSGTFRMVVRGPALELWALGSDDERGGGVVLHRPPDATAWAELDLPPLEFQLLRVLCNHALDRGDEAERRRAPIHARAMVRLLPFQSHHAGEDNVRQVVRRLRASLAAIGADPLIATAPGRGYYLTWSVTAT